MLVDLHVKSSASENVSVSLDKIFARAKEAGLDGLAFCETLSTAGCQETLDAAARAGMAAFIGVEIPTDKGILIGFAPEIDAFYLAEEWRQLTEYATPPAHQIIQMFDEMGGAVIASRPYDLTIPYNMGDLIFTLDNLHAVEVFNTRCGQVQCDFALEAAKFMGVPTVGGTDPQNESAFGRYATFFEHKFETQRQFVNALRDQEYWAVQFGPTPEQPRRPREDRGGRDDRGKRDGGKRDGDRRGGRGGGGGRDRDRGGRGGGGGGGGRGRGGRGGGGRGRRRD